MTCNIDPELFELTRRQHGAFSRRQAKELGFTDRVIDRRLSAGVWRRLHSGIYSPAATRVTTRTLASGALLAIPGSLVSHQFAAELQGFNHVPRGIVAITAPPNSNHRFQGVTVHEYAGIDEADRQMVDGIAVTAPALTVMHLSAVMRKPRVEAVMDDCLAARVVRWEELSALADFWTRRGRPGGRLMRGLIESRGPGWVAPESELERAFVRMIDRAGLPQPTRQFTPPWDRGAGRVDFAYVERRILIELDGRRWHTRERDFQKDRARDREAQLQGWVVLRFTYYEVVERSEDAVLSDLRRALAR